MISFLANPLRFLKFARIAGPVFGFLALILIPLGLWFGLYHSPEDYQQGHSVRIMYVHVPAVWTGMMAYLTMAIASLIAFIWRHPLADELAKSCALPGAAFTALGLITGALWGKTSWGTYWQWDGRLTSTLVLFFLFLGYLAIWSLIEDKKRAARTAGLVAMVGSLNLPIIKFSVDWWNSLHQSSSLTAPGAPGLPAAILTPLLIMALGYSFFFGWLVISKMQNVIVSHQEKRRKSEIKKSGTTAVMEKL